MCVIKSNGHLTAQKTPPNLVCWCVFPFTCRPTSLLLLVSHRSKAIPWYSIFAHSYGQPTRAPAPSLLGTPSILLY